MSSPESLGVSHRVQIEAGAALLEGEWTVPDIASGVVLFAHGSGSSRHSPRNQAVARALRDHQLETLLFDLLTPSEEQVDQQSGQLRFDIDFLASRLAAATQWARQQREGGQWSFGYFGSSTGGAAALVAAAALGSTIDGVVSWGGRPDLAGPALSRVQSPTLLIVGERDDVVRQLNEQAYRKLDCPKKLAVVPGATHLFEEPGALEEVARLAADWFQQHLHAGPSG